MESFLLKEKNMGSYFESIETYAVSSKASYRSVINRLQEFSIEHYDGRTADDVITELKSIPIERRDEAFYGVLQDYVNWLLKRGLSHKTVNNHFKVIKHYFSYYGIRGDPIGLKHNVNRPREVRERLHPLTLEEIHRIFRHTIQKRRMLYLVLVGSGMRIRECVALRKKDFDLNFSKRIKIEVPAQHTKTKAAHTTFVSEEAEKLLRPRLNSLKSEELMFATSQDSYHASMTEIEAFSRYRDAAGLIGKYESANRHHVTLHSFRSYFFTRARRIHDTDIAHAMVGHTPYLDMYDRKDDNEKLDLYLKVEPALRIDYDGPYEPIGHACRGSTRPRFKDCLRQLQVTKILNLRDFIALARSAQGFVIVADSKKGHRLHKSGCAWLQERHFMKKVISMNGKNVAYYWFGNEDCLGSGYKITRCKTCFGNQK